MLEQLFRTNEAAQSTVQGVVLAIAASFCLSFLLVLTYRATSREVVERREFMQGMALISIVATMVMQAIGDSLARGLGMLGALSIIRFRTSLTSPRNMSFMFASLAAGIACGVFGFTIALVGTLAFCLVAIALRYEFRDEASRLTGELRVTLAAEPGAREALERTLLRHIRRLELAERRYSRAPAQARSGAAGDPPAGKPSRDAAAPTGVAPAIESSVTSPPASTPSAQPAPQQTNGRAIATSLAEQTPRRDTPDADEAPARTQTLTYRFRLRDSAAELALLETVERAPAILQHRLRYLSNPESL